MEKVRIGILGASGYTGAELLRLLCYHPQAEIRALTADRQAGKPIGTVFPHLAGEGLPDLVAIGEVDWSALDAVFCALPHGTTQEVIAGLPRHRRSSICPPTSASSIPPPTPSGTVTSIVPRNCSAKRSTA